MNILSLRFFKIIRMAIIKSYFQFHVPKEKLPLTIVYWIRSSKMCIRYLKSINSGVAKIRFDGVLLRIEILVHNCEKKMNIQGQTEKISVEHLKKQSPFTFHGAGVVLSCTQIYKPILYAVRK